MKKPHKKKREKKSTKKTRALMVPRVTMEIFGKLLPAVDKKTLDDYICGVDSRLNDQQKNLFKATALTLKLNPLLKEVYAVGYYDRKTEKYQMSIIVGYDVYLKRAELTGTLDGWRSWTEGSVKEGNLKGMIEIFKRGWNFSFKHEVDYLEYVQKGYDKVNKTWYVTKFWKDKPKTMIKKVVEAQGFRKAYPNVLGGMPYISEELPPEMTEKNITPPSEKQETHNTKPGDVLPPEPVKEAPARQSQELIVQVKWADLRKADPVRYTKKFYDDTILFIGGTTLKDLTDKQLVSLIAELEAQVKHEKEKADAEKTNGA